MNRPETSVLIHNEVYRLYRIRSEKPLKRPKEQQAITTINPKERGEFGFRVTHVIFKSAIFNKVLQRI